MISSGKRLNKPYPILSASRVSKRFGNTIANDSISIDLLPGSIHALLGENGAGKTTLVSILYGLQQPDSGTLQLEGKDIVFHHPSDALHHGIALVQQHFSLIQDFTVLENIILGNEPHTVTGLSLSKSKRQINLLMEEYGLALPLHRRVCELPVGQQQQVEIAKVLYRNPKAILFDEPTAALVPHEIDRFLDTVHTLRQQGLAIVFITHRLPEVERIANEITVLRQGRTVLQKPMAKTGCHEIAKAIIGEELDEERYELHPPTESCLQIETISSLGEEPNIHDITLAIQKREILGIAGISGNGQEALLDCLMGLRALKSGRMELDLNDITQTNTLQRREAGMALIPQDRQRHALLSGHSLLENAMLNRIGLSHSQSFWTRNTSYREQVQEQMDALHVKAESPQQPVDTLSGGHQQRFVLSREFMKQPKCLLAYDPTHGLDIRAARFVHEKLLEACRAGSSLLLLSSDWNELHLLCHRIAVLYRGRIVEIRDTKDWNMNDLGQAMLGANR